MVMNVTVAAVKKTKHGGYGRRLATVVVPVEVVNGFANERAIHDAAVVELKKLLPTIKIATEILNWDI